MLLEIQLELELPIEEDDYKNTKEEEKEGLTIVVIDNEIKDIKDEIVIFDGYKN